MNTIQFASRLAAALAVALVVSGCGESPQSGHARKSDARPQEGPTTAFSAPGWKAGDAVGWEAQMRTRASAQNEYVRIGAQ